MQKFACYFNANRMAGMFCEKNTVNLLAISSNVPGTTLISTSTPRNMEFRLWTLDQTIADFFFSSSGGYSRAPILR